MNFKYFNKDLHKHSRAPWITPRLSEALYDEVAKKIITEDAPACLLGSMVVNDLPELANNKLLNYTISEEQKYYYGAALVDEKACDIVRDKDTIKTTMLNKPGFVLDLEMGSRRPVQQVAVIGKNDLERSCNIVIPTLNRHSLLDSCVKRCLVFSDAHVLVVEPGDEYAGEYKQIGLRASMRCPYGRDKILGHGEASMFGINALGEKAKYTCLLNDDALPLNAGWLRRLLNVLESDESIGIITPISLYPDGLIYWAGSFLIKNEEERLATDKLSILHGPNWRKSLSQLEQDGICLGASVAIDSYYANMACAVTRTELLLKYPLVGHYGDDAKFSREIVEKEGLKIAVLMDPSIVHFHGMSNRK